MDNKRCTTEWGKLKQTIQQPSEERRNEHKWNSEASKLHNRMSGESRVPKTYRAKYKVYEINSGTYTKLTIVKQSDEQPCIQPVFYPQPHPIARSA